MNRITSLSNEARLNVAGLVVAAIGILLEIGAGSGLYPTLTGPVVLLVGAALVVLRPSRLTAYVGLIIPTVLGIGLAVSAVLSPDFLEQVVQLSNPALVFGSLLHVAGLIAAIGGGIAMVLRRAITPSDAPQTSH